MDSFSSRDSSNFYEIEEEFLDTNSNLRDASKNLSKE